MTNRASKCASLVISAICSICLNGHTAHAQDIPPGVRYRRATDVVNSRAKTQLETALSAIEVPTEFMQGPFTCGPTLWMALKPFADQLLLGSKVIDGFVSTPQPTHVELRAPVTDDEHRAFWKLLAANFPALRSAKIRKANASEISYYWATIPFDIEEPFFAIDAGKDTFIAQLVIGKDRPVLFWIDKIGDLKAFKK